MQSTSKKEKKLQDNQYIYILVEWHVIWKIILHQLTKVEKSILCAHPFGNKSILWSPNSMYILHMIHKIYMYLQDIHAAATAKSLQLCPTLCDPIDGSPSGSPVPGILQARTLEWVAISFCNAWKWKVKRKSLSHVRLLATPWTTAYQTPPSMGFSRQEYWSGVPLPSPRIYIDAYKYIYVIFDIFDILHIYIFICIYVYLAYTYMFYVSCVKCT